MDRLPVKEMTPVSLVGAGPGDPGLMTLKGAERLRCADVVFHDALVSAEVLGMCRRGARRIDVGRRRGFAPMAFDEVVAALAREARAGRRVVRLKGGDPFVFGRGSEEALALLRAGVACEVVPGVCSGTALPALAGIPLTHRDLAGSAAFVTAHDLTTGRAGARVKRRLRHLARGAETLVVFMARDELDRVGRTLVAAGLPGGTPAAIILSGSTPEEIVLDCTLEDLGAAILHRRGGPEAAGRRGPALLVVGQTVSLRPRVLAAQEAARGPAPGVPEPEPETDTETIERGVAVRFAAARRRAV